MSAFALLYLVLLSCQGPKTVINGPSSPNLKPCPDSPNCVSSLAADGRHYVKPFELFQPPEDAMRVIKEAILSFPRTSLITESDCYLHVECRTLLGFVDDVEFMIDKMKSMIQVRSASRIGYWDMGANRRRVEELRTRYQALVKVYR
ncbi:MAG: DUF1499 domain-containing protein [Dissulfurispiraceae bacterium]